MNAITNVEVDTRPAAGAEAVTTNLSINWEGVSPEEVQALAQQALVVKLQGKWRKDGIPAGDFSVNASDYKIGVRAPRVKQTLEQMLAALSPAERAALVAKFAG